MVNRRSNKPQPKVEELDSDSDAVSSDNESTVKRKNLTEEAEEDDDEFESDEENDVFEFSEDEEDEEEADEEDDDEIEDDDGDVDVDEDGEVINIGNVETNNVNIETISVRTPDDERITPPILNKYEMTRILGERTKQLIEGAPPLVIVNKGETPVQVAISELLTKKMPFLIKRQMPYAQYEIWKLRDLEVLITEDDIDELVGAIK
jgi:DNA-directed RNA polymerase subunit K/omega